MRIISLVQTQINLFIMYFDCLSLKKRSGKYVTQMAPPKGHSKWRHDDRSINRNLNPSSPSDADVVYKPSPTFPFSL